MSVTGGQGEKRGSKEKALCRERERGREKRADEREFSVMDDLSSYRNQKPNLPSPLLAKAHNAVMQEGSLG